MASEQTQGIPNQLEYGVGVQLPKQVLSDDGAITILAGGVVELTKAGVSAITLAVPAVANGAILVVTSKTAQAHTLTAASGLYGLGTGSDVGTFGGAIGDCVTLISRGGYWTQMANVNVTWA
jgi:hypothetical protein